MPKGFCIVRMPENVYAQLIIRPSVTCTLRTRLLDEYPARNLGGAMCFSSCRYVFRVSFLALAFAAPLLAQNVHLSIDASKPGVKIDRNIFGQFAENLGHGLYEGIWVGPDSPIPNTRGIRNDVVSALRELKVPNVRWPCGCFADQFHWRMGIGPAD